jgi:hypothetical protein
MTMIFNVNAQSNVNFNIWLNTTPGIGICTYNQTRGFGMGLSVLHKLVETSSNIDIWGSQYRRYSPTYTEIKLDVFTGRSRSRDSTRKYRLNPFIYGYFGNGKATFTEWQGTSSYKKTSVVEYTKVSAGLGLHIFHCYNPKSNGSAFYYFFWGFSVGIKDVRSKVPVYPGFGDNGTDHFALRVKAGLLISLIH